LPGSHCYWYDVELMNARIIRILTIAFAMALVLFIFMTNQGVMPSIFYSATDMPGFDKAGHFILMGLFSFLVNMSLSAATVGMGRMRILKGSLIVTVIVTLEEFSQVFVASRSCSLWDLLFDYAGIFCFGRLACYLTERAASR
jgi:hypothetical protein